MCLWGCPWEFPQPSSTAPPVRPPLEGSRKIHGARRGAGGNPGNPCLTLHQNSLTDHVPASTPDPTPEEVLVLTWPGAAPGGNGPHGDPTELLLSLLGEGVHPPEE